jgi:hypothetical protein
VTTPQEPEDEPVGDELAAARPDGGPEGGPEGDPGGGPDGGRDEDAAWRAIVENYGDRPAIEEPEIAVPPSPRDLTRPPRSEPEDGIEADDDPEDHFVPPPPPPLPKPPPAHLLAWLGLFGVPTFVLVALVAGLDLPSWLGPLLMAWFVGGFVFLVASMKQGPGENTDDGARL